MKTETFETNTKEHDPQVLIDTFFTTYPDLYNEEDEKKIRNAWNFLLERTGEMKRSCGLPYYLHPM
ncbi:MAG: bifunctional (p)ppGpp synthetase/guanosine-3',5'-bis(diphosphate) 3'-pyrophosphohydrolase, partial [Treponema sp.]|nr:bifunctional (p)ppGpp synthetase/guanosine-3',5'-bis(diphosphate) 3'-pyrophosphohydrolase [Treponema sp.]